MNNGRRGVPRLNLLTEDKLELFWVSVLNIRPNFLTDFLVDFCREGALSLTFVSYIARKLKMTSILYNIVQIDFERVRSKDRAHTVSDKLRC